MRAWLSLESGHQSGFLLLALHRDIKYHPCYLGPRAPGRMYTQQADHGARRPPKVMGTQGMSLGGQQPSGLYYLQLRKCSKFSPKVHKAWWQRWQWGHCKALIALPGFCFLKRPSLMTLLPKESTVYLLTLLFVITFIII